MSFLSQLFKKTSPNKTTSPGSSPPVLTPQNSPLALNSPELSPLNKKIEKEVVEFEKAWAKAISSFDKENKRYVEDIRAKIPQKAWNVLLKLISKDSMRMKSWDKLSTISEVLSNPKMMKDAYLSTTWKDQIKKETSFHSSNEKGSMFASRSEIEEIEMVDPSEMKGFENEFKQKIKEIKIKLVITEITKSSLQKGFVQVVSPILHKLTNASPEFGFFHTSVMIGPWLIEWNDSSLCVPRKCLSQAALISADIESIPTEQKLNEIVENLSVLICEWNSNRTYREGKPQEQSDANCQDFVMAVLSKLGIQLKFHGPLGEFIKKLKEEGKCKIQFPMDNEFRATFDIKEKCKEFKTHLDLDEFAEMLTSHKEWDMAIPMCRDAWTLLKSFDRAFWLKHLRFPDDAKFKYSSKEGEDEFGNFCINCMCPFGDPHATGSMISGQ